MLQQTQHLGHMLKLYSVAGERFAPVLPGMLRAVADMSVDEQVRLQAREGQSHITHVKRMALKCVPA